MPRRKCINAIFFALLLVFIGGVTFLLFFRQAQGNASYYPSDMEAYILEMQGLESGYDFPYPIFFKFSAFLHLFFPAAFSVALATMLLNTASFVLLKVFFDKLYLEKTAAALGGRACLAGPLLSLLAASFLFVSMLFTDHLGIYLPGISFRYLGVFTANPYHNATYLAARPFAIVTFFLLAKVLTDYEDRHLSFKWYAAFALSLLLATMTKPSFTILCGMACLLLLLFRLIKNKGKTLKATVLFGLCFLPTFVDLLYQYKGVFVASDGSESGVGFCLGEIWLTYIDNFFLGLLLAMAFPIVVLLFHFRRIGKDTRYSLSWLLYLCGLFSAFFLYEKGYRAAHFNFSWGYMVGIFFAFLGSAEVLLQDTIAKNKPLRCALQWLVLAAHVVCGLTYFIFLLLGKSYY